MLFPQPTQPPDLVEGGVIGDDEEGGITRPVGVDSTLGPFPGIGGLIRKGSLPEGIIIWLC
ncbi:MAG TPA: hypothetical protein VIX80_05460 [Candidatus Kapabacteria bacterium]